MSQSYPTVTKLQDILRFSQVNFQPETFTED